MPANADRGRVVIAGGSGFLGLSLATFPAEKGWSVAVLSRRPPRREGPWRHVSCDAPNLGEWSRTLAGASGLVNLVGRSVDCVKTPDHQDEILRSRIEATRTLGLAVRRVDTPPPVWVQMSTAHIYGDPPEVACTEDSPFGYGLAPFVGRAWESEFEQAALPMQRRVVLRTSFVIGRDRGAGGGALARLLTLVRLGLRTTKVSGQQRGQQRCQEPNRISFLTPFFVLFLFAACEGLQGLTASLSSCRQWSNRGSHVSVRSARRRLRDADRPLFRSRLYYAFGQTHTTAGANRLGSCAERQENPAA